MDNQPIETKNYRKPKKNRNPMTMLVLGFVIGAALSTGSFWAGALYATGRDNQSVSGNIQVSGQTTGKTESTTLTTSVGLAFKATSTSTCEIAGIGTCSDSEIIVPQYIAGLYVTSIVDSAFRDCKSLTSIVMQKGVANIGATAFLGCENLENVTIPEGVTKIGSSAFQKCKKLDSINIPESLTRIENYAFHSCGSLLTINYPLNISGWKSISKGTAWDANTPNYIVYCTDGTISKDGTVTYYN